MTERDSKRIVWFLILVGVALLGMKLLRFLVKSASLVLLVGIILLIVGVAMNAWRKRR